MGERGPAGPDDELCLKAWEANVRGANLPAIARAERISVSTARRWVRRGRKLAAELAYGPDGDLRRHAMQHRVNAVMQEARRVLFDAIDDGSADPVQAALAIIKSIDVESTVLGYRAPAASKVELTPGQARPVGPEPFVVDAVDDYAARRARGEIE